MDSKNTPSWQEAKNILREWRDNNERKSEEVMHLWKTVVEYNLNKFGSDKFSVLEQVCVAALDRHDLAIANRCIQQLSAEFPNSLRVKKYKAMRLEAYGNYDGCTRCLDSILKSDETSAATRKRKVALLLAQDHTTEAIKELTDYIKIYMADTEAWQMACDLYINANEFSKAAFCVEELILHNPHNHLLHQRYADIKYTQGGYENMELARAYYCQALKLNNSNLRALYGIYMTSSYLLAHPKCLATKKKECSKLADWAFAEINKTYAEKLDNYEENKLGERLAALQLS